MNATERPPRNVLVPIDGSPLSYDALRHALGRFPEASITVLHVIDLFDPAAGFDPTYEPLPGSEAWDEHTERLTEELFAEAETIADAHDRRLTTETEIGTPERIIVEFAAEEPIDQIVLGTHGRADADEPIYGSIAETVARRSTVPVTLVR